MSMHVINPLFKYGGGNNHVTDFNGVDQYLDLGHATGLEFTNTQYDTTGVTVTAWVYFDSTACYGKPILTIGRQGTNQYYGMHCKTANTGKIQMHLMGLNSGVAGAGSNNRRTRVTTTYVVPVTTWTHIAWVFDGGVTSSTAAGWKIFINGVNQTTTNSGTNTNLTLDYVGDSRIGSDGKASGTIKYYGPGYLGDITIHQTALPEKAVKAQYDSNNNGIDWRQPTGTTINDYTAAHAATLKAWWRMGSPDGPATYPTIYEEVSMPSGYNGTMTNMSSGDIDPSPLW
tara:strand:- start:7726 stop:8583 length:858 start_codon:yes stop_codon:yes gene_type:complete